MHQYIGDQIEGHPSFVVQTSQPVTRNTFSTDTKYNAYLFYTYSYPIDFFLMHD